MNFSKPRFLWNVTPPSFPAPKALPIPASDFCKRMMMINIIENMIWSQDSIPSMGTILAEKEKACNTHKMFLFIEGFAKIASMESFKANLIIFVFVVLAVALGYWAITSLRTNSASMIVENTSDDVGPMITSEPDNEPAPTPVTETPDPVTPEPEEEPEPVGEHASLISDLQDLIDDKVLMKKGSRGTRVGVVQKFLIEYGIDMDRDNDYGDTTVNAVKKFQTEQKLSADGQTGEGTYKKMIEWLNNN